MASSPNIKRIVYEYFEQLLSKNANSDNPTDKLSVQYFELIARIKKETRLSRNKIDSAITELISQKSISNRNGRIYKNYTNTSLSNDAENKENVGQSVSMVGIIQEDANHRFVCIPIDKKFHIKSLVIVNQQDAKGHVGELVGGTCVRTADGTINPVINIQESFGNPFNIDPIKYVNVIYYKYGVSNILSDEVKSQASQLPTRVSEVEVVELKNKYSKAPYAFMDMRDKAYCTVDPATCLDMDDAIYTEKLPDGTYMQYTAIALTAYYIKKGSPIANSSHEKGNTMYCASSCVGMNPIELANGICSINEGTDRLVMITQTHLATDGHTKLSYKTTPGVIRSRHKLTYEQAQAIHDNEHYTDEVNGKVVDYSDVKASLDASFELAYKQQLAAKERGKIDIPSHEATFKFSPDGKTVEKITEDNNTESHKMIESMMLLTNENIAQFCRDHNIPIPYRVHEDMAPEDINEIVPILNQLDINVEDIINNSADADDECDIRTVLQNIITYVHENKPKLEEFVSELIITKTARAKYVASPSSHFALACECYSHTTSPIRRKVDEIIESQLLAFFAGEPLPYTEEEIQKACEHYNSTERIGDQISREGAELCCAQYAKQHMNEEYNGYIREIYKDHLVVKASGMRINVPIQAYTKNAFEENTRSMIKAKDLLTNKNYVLGQSFDVKIDKVDIANHSVYGKNVEQTKSMYDNDPALSKIYGNRSNDGKGGK